MPIHIKKSEMPVSAEKLFAWHENPSALERLIPPWNHVKVLRKDLGLKPGAEVHLKTYIGLIPVTWVARHTDYIAGKEFCDVQISGPFAKWVHHHRVIPKNATQSFLEDEIEYQTYGGLGNRLAGRSIEQLFDYRHTLLRQDLEVQNHFPTNPLTIAMTGSGSLIGQELAAFLQTAGHKVLPFVRREAKKDEIAWDIDAGKIEIEKLEGVDGVIHLSDENIPSRKGSIKEKKKRMEDSRTRETALLVETLNHLLLPPKVFISASSIQAVKSERGATDSAVFKKEEAEGQGFTNGRIVSARVGVVLTPRGGALSKILTPFKMGFGIKLKSEKQLMSWIAIDDLIYQLYRLLLTPSIDGAVDLAAPQIVTHLEFSKTLASVLHCRCLLPLPAFIGNRLFRGIAEASALSNVGVHAKQLEQAKLHFYHPDLFSALKHLLGKRSK